MRTFECNYSYSKSCHLKIFLAIIIFLFAAETELFAQDGPLGEWPDFTPLGFITAPHPQDSNYQTHLYGDWGGIVGEEFLVIQDGLIKLFYHSYHETYMTKHLHQQDILADWELGYDPVTFQKYTPLAHPGGPFPGPAWDHTDTPAYILHPLTGEHLLYNTVRPGTKHLHPEWDDLPGWEGAIQVATSETPPEIGSPFVQSYENILEAELWWEQGWNQNGVIKGGLSEPTPVWVPHLGTSGKVRLFYRGLHGSPGSYWNWRISYADSEDGKTNWEKKGEPTWDPSDPDNPAYQWSLPYPQGFSFRGAWQAHCTGDTVADGVHMVLTVSNQNYAGFGHIAYYWSPDWGDTWISHPDNPIIAPGQFEDGVPGEGFQRTPALVVDDEFNRYILAYNAGHDAEEKWKKRTYLATASRPVITSNEEKYLQSDILHVKGFPNPFSVSTTISFSVAEKGHIELTIYDLKGQKIHTLVDEVLNPGNHSFVWFGNDKNKQSASPGVYFYKIRSNSSCYSGKIMLTKK